MIYYTNKIRVNAINQALQRINESLDKRILLKSIIESKSVIF